MALCLCENTLQHGTLWSIEKYFCGVITVQRVLKNENVEHKKIVIYPKICMWSFSVDSSMTSYGWGQQLVLKWVRNNRSHVQIPKGRWTLLFSKCNKFIFILKRQLALGLHRGTAGSNSNSIFISCRDPRDLGWIFTSGSLICENPSSPSLTTPECVPSLAVSLPVNK